MFCSIKLDWPPMSSRLSSRVISVVNNYSIHCLQDGCCNRSAIGFSNCSLIVKYNINIVHYISFSKSTIIYALKCLAQGYRNVVSLSSFYFNLVCHIMFLFFQIKAESKLREENLRTELEVLRTTSVSDREMIDILLSQTKYDRDMKERLQSESTHDKEVIEKLKSELDDIRISFGALYVDCCALRMNEEFSNLVSSLDMKSEYHFVP